MGWSPEQMIQIDCVNFTRLFCPDVLLSASQNGMFLGSNRGKIAGYIARQKILGMLPGEPDLMLTWPNRGILFIEVKAGKNDVTDEQEKVCKKRIAHGFDCMVVWSLREYVDALTLMRVPRKGGYMMGVGRFEAIGL